MSDHVENRKLHRTVTADTLRRDRDRRDKEREKLAVKYEAAAKVLDEHYVDHREAGNLLREEAARWRR